MAEFRWTTDAAPRSPDPPLRIKRRYQSWVAKETLEDYALRYAARSFRRWSPFVVANTAIGGISFLALEAIGASITMTYGFANAVPAILLVSALIFLISIPIAYHCSVANIDIDLLTRGAGFGFLGSTITSLIYASFTFIFFAIEAAIMAQALEVALGLNIVLGYVLSSLIIIPCVFFGVTFINRLQLWTQPLWIVLLVLPFAFILHQDPGLLRDWRAYAGEGPGRFDVLALGAATGVLFSLVVQIGEQADYLRFLPPRGETNRVQWWLAMLTAGPGWIVLGALKILAGSLLGYIVIRSGSTVENAVTPMHMYLAGYGYVFDDSALVVAVAAVFVVLSQVKINVTNAYGGSLAWSNCFARLAHYHPGRVVWLVFNVLIALLLSLLGIFATLDAVLSFYSAIAIAWVGALVADLVVLKPLGVSPRRVEFKRAHLYNFNPVGCGAMLFASVAALLAHAGAFGEVARAYFAFIALGTACVAAIAIALLTGGRYYIARRDVRFSDGSDTRLVRCCICEREYEGPDMAECPFYRGSICSLCCGLDNHCHDACKRPASAKGTPGATVVEDAYEPHLARRVGRFLALFAIVAVVVGAVFLLSYRLVAAGQEALAGAELVNLLSRLYIGTLLVSAVGVWWIILSQESRELTARELLQSMHYLEVTRKELVESEKLALLGSLVAGVAHEINNPVGISVSAASFLRDRTESVNAALAQGKLSREELLHYLDEAGESSRLLLSNARRAADLVQTFKRVAVDQASEQRRRFDLRSYIEETLLGVRGKLKEAGASVRLDCPVGVELDSYPGAFAQVLTNLLLNSIQHGIPTGRSAEIRIDVHTLGTEAVELRYADNGPGIPPALYERVFEPFFSTRRGSGGTGLGLHIAYNLVTRTLGGSISLVTGPKGAAVFVLRLPRTSPGRADIAGTHAVVRRSDEDA